MQIKKLNKNLKKTNISIKFVKKREKVAISKINN